jgi:hypothetical protein
VLHRGECHAFTPPDVARLIGESSGNREETRLDLQVLLHELMDAFTMSLVVLDEGKFIRKHAPNCLIQNVKQ